MNHFLMSCLLSILTIACSLNLGSQEPASNQKVVDLEVEARRYLQEQKPDLAIPVFRQIVLLDPQNVDARGNLGVLLFFQGKYGEAIPEIRAALSLHPQLWRIQALLGVAEKRTGDLVSAQSDLAASFPSLDDAKIQKEAGLELIEIESAFGQLDQAAAVVAKLEQTMPEDPRILLAGYQISTQTIERTLLNAALVAPNSAELHMMMADQFVLESDSDNAIAQFREAIRLNPRLPGVHFELAMQLRNSSDPSLRTEAEREFKTALSLNQFDQKAWRGLGEMMASKGDLAAAKDDYLKALALSPKDSDVETDLAKVSLALDDRKAAKSLLEDAVKHDPTNIVAHYQLSGVYRLEGRAADAQHEMDEFLHYRTLKNDLSKVFARFREQNVPLGADRQPSQHSN
jgi:Flp pilus assembly protein TadD